MLSSSGRIVKSNPLLLGRLGFIPGTVDLNMDAVDIGPGGEIFFSLDTDMFSETLGQIRNGDLVSNRGRIVHRNPELMQEFGLDLTTGDVGLDAIVIKDDGEILFSLAKDTFPQNSRRRLVMEISFRLTDELLRPISNCFLVFIRR